MKRILQVTVVAAALLAGGLTLGEDAHAGSCQTLQSGSVGTSGYTQYCYVGEDRCPAPAGTTTTTTQLTCWAQCAAIDSSSGGSAATTGGFAGVARAPIEGIGKLSHAL